MLDLQDITKAYEAATGTLVVLKGISLFVERGEFVSVMGPSGSGKSTLAAILGCLSSPTSGKFFLNGQSVTDLSPRALARFRNEQIGFVFQDFKLLEGMTTVENVALPLVYAGVGYAERKRRAIECLEKVNLGDRLSHTPKQLSGGQKQRVAIARALVNNPSLIFADEPTGALDEKNTVEVMELLQRLNIAGHTIVQVTHASEDAQYSKRIVSLIDGQIIKDEPVQSFVIASPRAAEADKPGTAARLWRIARALKPQDASDHLAMRRLLLQTDDIRGLIEAGRVLTQYDIAEFNTVLLKLFRNPHWAVRAEIVRACDVAANDNALAVFIKGVKDENAWVRFSALSQLKRLPQSLQKIGGEELLVGCLDDKDERVRAVAVTLVGAWGDTRLVERLAGLALNDKNPRVRSNCLEVLKAPGLIDNEIVSATLRACCADKHHRIATTAAVLVFPTGEDLGRQVLAARLRSDNIMDRAAAAWGYGAIEDQGASGTTLIDVLKDEREEFVATALIAALTRCARKGFTFSRQVELALANHKINRPKAVG